MTKGVFLIIIYSTFVGTQCIVSLLFCFVLIPRILREKLVCLLVI